MLATRELGQRVSAAWPVDPEILRRPYHFLLEIEHYSGFWCFSDADLDIEDKAGRVFSYAGELDDPSFTQELQVFEVTEGSGSFEAAISFPEDMKALADRGFPLAGARALVWLWWEGTQLEDSVLLLDGRISDPRVGEEGEPVSFSVEAVPLEDDAPFLEPEAKVDSSTWPQHATGARGLFYPWVFGWPYRYSRVDGSSGVTSGSPARYVDTSAGTMLISDSETEVGAKYDGAGASQVRLYNVSTGDSFDGEAQHATDGRGRVVTVVDCSGAPAGFLDVEASYVCRWDSGGGVLGASSLKTTEGDGRGPLSLAGDVVAHLLRRSPQVFDPDALAAAARFLNAIEVAGYFDDGRPARWSWRSTTSWIRSWSAPTPGRGGSSWCR